MTEYVNRRMNEEAEKWYYDLGQLAEKVETNRQNALAAEHRSDVNRKRQWALTLFTLVAFFTLAYRAQTVTSQQRSNLVQTQHSLLRACQVRNATIAAVNNLRQTEETAYRQFKKQEQANRFIDNKLRVERVTTWGDLAQAALAARLATPQQDCSIYTGR